MHNFGVGHAWYHGQTYGDPYDVVGGGGSEHDVAAATKHRWGWITSSESLELSPSSLAPGTSRTIKLRAHDTANAPSTLGTDEYLTVRLETSMVGGVRCNPIYAWCPQWTTAGNDWRSESGFYLYVSYRAAQQDTASGATLHVAKYNDGWVDATALLPIRATSPTLRPTLEVGDTYVFDELSSHSIVLQTMSLTNGVLEVKVTYADGAAAASAYELQHAAHLCTHTLSCGSKLEMHSAAAVDSLGHGVLLKVGELHSLTSKIRLCADTPGKAAPAVYAYDQFPIAQALYGAPLDINAKATLSDMCHGANGPPGAIKVNVPDVWWLNGVELSLYDYTMVAFDGDYTKQLQMQTGSSYPHYVGQSHYYNVHLHMAMCDMYYCKDSGSSATSPSGYRWVLGYSTLVKSCIDSFACAGVGFSEYFAPVDGTMTDPSKLFDASVQWYDPSNQPFDLPRFQVLPHQTLRVGQKAGEHTAYTHAAIGWLAASFDSTSSASIALHDCDLSSCTNGYSAADSIECSGHQKCQLLPCCNGCSTEPVQGEQYQGSAACFWDSPNITITVRNLAGELDPRSGVYKKSGTYPVTDWDDQTLTRPTYANGNHLLRNDQEYGWFLTASTNNEVGSSWGTGWSMDDLQMPSECEQCSGSDYSGLGNYFNRYPGVPFPSLIPGVPCAGCATAKWSSLSSDEFTVTFQLPDKVASTPRGADEQDTCTCSDHSVAAEDSYCLVQNATTIEELDAKTCSVDGAPPVAVKVEIVASGDVSDYSDTKKSEIASSFAASAGVAADSVLIEIVPASVRIIVTVNVTNSYAAQTVQSSLTDALSTTSAAETLLNLPAGSVESIQPISVISIGVSPPMLPPLAPSSPPMLPPKAPSTGSDVVLIGALAGALGGAALLLTVCIAGFFVLRKRRLKQVKPAEVSVPKSNIREAAVGNPDAKTKKQAWGVEDAEDA